MKIKPGFILRQLAGENVVVPVGAAGASFNGMIRLNDTGALLWKELAAGTDEETLVQKLMEACDGVDADTVRTDVREFLTGIQVALDG